MTANFLNDQMMIIQIMIWGLVTLNQPQQGPTNPGLPAHMMQPSIFPLAPPGGSRLTLSDVGTAPTP